MIAWFEDWWYHDTLHMMQRKMVRRVWLGWTVRRWYGMVKITSDDWGFE